MGPVGDLFGEEKKTKQKTRVKLPSYVQEPLERLLQRTEDLSERPFPAFDPERRVAPLSEDEQAAFDLIRQQLGGGQEETQFGQDILQDIIGRRLAGPSDEDIQARMDPYISNVLDRVTGEAERDFEKRLNQLGAQASASGAFGGSRQAVAEGEAFDDMADQLADIRSRGLSDAYNQALGQYQTDLSGAAQGANQLASLSAEEQSQLLRQAGALQGIGQTERQLDQTLRDAEFQEFQRQQQDPFNLVNFLSSQVLPAGQLTRGTNTTTTTETTPGLGRVALGIAGTAMGLGGGNMFGNASHTGGGSSGFNLGGLSTPTALNIGSQAAQMAGPVNLNRSNVDMFGRPIRFEDGGSVENYQEGGSVGQAPPGGGFGLLSLLPSDPQYDRRGPGENILETIARMAGNAGTFAATAPGQARDFAGDVGTEMGRILKEDVGGALTRPRYTDEELLDPTVAQSLPPEEAREFYTQQQELIDRNKSPEPLTDVGTDQMVSSLMKELGMQDVPAPSRKPQQQNEGQQPTPQKTEAPKRQASATQQQQQKEEGGFLENINMPLLMAGLSMLDPEGSVGDGIKTYVAMVDRQKQAEQDKIDRSFERRMQEFKMDQAKQRLAVDKLKAEAYAKQVANQLQQSQAGQNIDPDTMRKFYRDATDFALESAEQRFATQPRVDPATREQFIKEKINEFMAGSLGGGRSQQTPPQQQQQPAAPLEEALFGGG